MLLIEMGPSQTTKSTTISNPIRTETYTLRSIPRLEKFQQKLFLTGSHYINIVLPYCTMGFKKSEVAQKQGEHLHGVFAARDFKAGDSDSSGCGMMMNADPMKENGNSTGLN